MEKIEGLGAKIVRHTDILTTLAENQELIQAGGRQMSIEIKDEMGRYLEQRKDLNINTLEDIVNFNKSHQVGIIRPNPD